MRIGYSMWGFLGSGVLDTPDGSRSYRRPLIDALIAAGHQVVFLQINRDLVEAGEDLRDRYRWDDGLPALDVLILEWRWPLPGRNDTPCAGAGHTCDLHRQRAVVEHYARSGGLPTLIWDLDRQLLADDPLRQLANVAVADFALRQQPGVATLPCPVPDALLDAADPAELVALDRPTDLVYVGNRYDRDAAFNHYFAPAARHLLHQVAGKWADAAQWPHVTFTGRVGFEDVAVIHRRSLATVLLMPQRYAAHGAMSSRLFEAVTAGCLPLTTAELVKADVFVPPDLQVADAAEVIDRVRWLRSIQGSGEHADLIRACLDRLDPFRTSRQVTAIERIFRTITGPAGPVPATHQPATPIGS